MSRIYTPPIAGARKRILKQLRDLGIDVELTVINDAPNAAALSEAVHALRKIAKLMAQPPAHATAPTPERRAKAERVIEIEIAPGRPTAHAMVWPVDQIRQSTGMTEDEYQAAERYRAAHDTLHKSQGVGSYGQNGSRGTHSRLELTERQQVAGRELDLVRIMLTQEARHAAQNFILEQPCFDNSPVMSFVGFGTFWSGCMSPDRARAYAQSYLRATCAQIAMAYRRIDAENRNAAMANRRAAG